MKKMNNIYSSLLICRFVRIIWFWFSPWQNQNHFRKSWFSIKTIQMKMILNQNHAHLWEWFVNSIGTFNWCWTTWFDSVCSRSKQCWPTWLYNMLDSVYGPLYKWLIKTMHKKWMNKCAGVAFIQNSWVHVKLHISYKTIKMLSCYFFNWL